MKKTTVIFLFFLTVQPAFSQDWELKKETDNARAYLRSTESSLKEYKIVSYFNASANCIYNNIVDFNNYQKAIKDLKELTIISNKENVIIAYWVYGLPWPYTDRDVVTKTTIKRKEGKTEILTTVYNNHKIPEKESLVRIADYSDLYIIEEISAGKTKVTLTGRVDVGGKVPAWVQNLFLTDSPLEFIEYIRDRCLD